MQQPCNREIRIIQSKLHETNTIISNTIQVLLLLECLLKKNFFMKKFPGKFSFLNAGKNLIS